MILIFFLLFFSVCTPARDDGISRWEKFASTGYENLVLLGGADENDLWCTTNRGEIIHFVKTRPHIFTLPEKSVKNIYSYLFLPDRIYISVIREDYSSALYRFKDGLFYKYDTPFSVPVKGMISMGNESLLIYGDWGMLYTLKNGENPEKISSGIRNHILSARKAAGGEIYLGTRSEGIWRLKDGRFTQLKMTNPERKEITGFSEDSSGDLYAITSESEILILKGDEFIYTDANRMMFLFTETPAGSPGIFNARYSESLPSGIKLTGNLKITNYKMLDNGTIAGVSSSGDFYRHSFSSTPEFAELSSEYGLNQNLFMQATSAIFTDVNNDGLQDLYLINSLNLVSSKLYINNRGKPFEEFSVSFSPEPELPIANSSLVDFDNDGRAELLLVLRDKKELRLNLYTPEEDKPFQFNLISPDFLKLPLRTHQLNFSDIDRNGLTDIIASVYLTEEQTKGYADVYLNHLYGRTFSRDTTLRKLSSGWNTNLITADFNGDDISDYYFAFRWKTDIILLSSGEKFMTDSAFHDGKLPYNTLAAVSFDTDNDGDLDLILSSEEEFLTLLENKGGRFYKNHSPLPGSPLSVNPASVKSVHYRTADFNNDGWLDLLINYGFDTSYQNMLFMNDRKGGFEDLSEFVGIRYPFTPKSVIADIDDDGDIDILGYGQSGNYLWINTLDNRKFIKVRLETSESNKGAYNTKIYLYSAGHSGDKKFLLGYRETGSDANVLGAGNEAVIHFGLEEITAADIIVRFPSGRIVKKYNIPAGTIVTVNETGLVTSVLYLIPPVLLDFFTNSETYLYASSILLAAFILYFGMNQIKRKYRTDELTVIVILAVNISVYWISLFLTSRFDGVFKYYSAAGFLTASILLPHLLFLRLYGRKISGIRPELLYDKLLEHHFKFFHGEWAANNLNGILLFAKNLKQNPENKKEIEERFFGKISLFRELTMESVSEIILLHKETETDDPDLSGLEKSADTLVTATGEILHSLKDEEIHTRLETVTAEIPRLKNYLQKLRFKTFLHFSTPLIPFLEKLTGEFRESNPGIEISLEVKSETVKQINVLIKPAEFTVILDNLFRNSAAALGGCNKKNIWVSVERRTPKIIMEFRDNGHGISDEILEKIFERGFSGHNSTGTGLADSRSTLLKYGGRLYMKESLPFQNTTFVIELNESHKDAKPDSADR